MEMEGSESERVFDTFNLNPRLFINEVRNAVDDTVDGAFEFYREKALAVLENASKDEADELNKGISSISSVIQEVLDRRLYMWEKYCLHRCFVVPEGFSLPKADKSDGTLMDVDVLLDADLDVQLDSLREKLFWADKEATKLQRELQLLEKQSVLSDKRAEYVNEAVQLFEENSLPDMFQEMQKTAAELREKIENFRVKRTSEIRQDKIERMHDLNGHTFMHKRKGFYLTEFEGVLAFVADMKSI